MQCTACGRENRDAAGYCAWCGERLAPKQGQAEPAQDQSVAVAETPVEAAPKLQPDEPAQVEVEVEVQPEPEAEPEPILDGPPPPASREPGDVLLDRYLITEVLSVERDHVQYRAEDLIVCSACGSEESHTNDAFCVRCGASLSEPIYVLITEQTRYEPETYDLRLTEGGREYFVLKEKPTAPEPEAERAKPLRLAWGCLTDKGIERDHNEDAIDVRVYTRSDGSKLGLFVVADGLGGQDAGEVASQMTIDTVWSHISETIWLPILSGYDLEQQVIVEALRKTINQANQAVYDARTQRNSDMSTTLTMALVVNDHATIGNIGDSRTYLHNADGLRQITKDHSLVQRLVDTGQLKPEEVYTHPRRNIVYQSIGDRPELQIDIFQHQLKPDDRLILCSDGLWEMVRDEGLQEVLLSEHDPQRACDRLVQNANLAGGEDNISVIVVQALA